MQAADEAASTARGAISFTCVVHVLNILACFPVNGLSVEQQQMGCIWCAALQQMRSDPAETLTVKLSTV